MAHRVVIEQGTRRVFAGALDWPGWTRAGRDEHAAIEHLLAAAPRYAALLAASGIGGFDPDDEPVVVERLPGDASTDFGAPGAVAVADHDPLGPDDLARSQQILAACWEAFEVGATAAQGVVLTTGPRGGGRDLDRIRTHVHEAERGYVARLGGTVSAMASPDDVHTAFLGALAARSRGEVPDRGPRGGLRWPARFGARYAAWHVLDHLWEIEDRST